MSPAFLALGAARDSDFLTFALVVCFLLTAGGIGYGIHVYHKQAKLIADLIGRAREFEARAASSASEYESSVRQKVQLDAEIAKLEIAARKADFAEGGVPHAELNKLHASKMKRELELLEVQVELARRDLALRGDHLAYHDQMMEKVKLEIESLKLQVREQRKRLEEF